MYKKINESPQKMILLDAIELHNLNDLPGQTEKHSHDFWELGYVLSGQGQYWNRNKTRMISEGDLMITRPNDLHYEYCSKGHNVYILFLLFEKSFFPDKAFHMDFKTSTVLATGTRLEIKNVFLNILTETLEQKSEHENMIRAELTRLFVYLSRFNNKELVQTPSITSLSEILIFRKKKIISDIKNFMENNLNRDINLDEIASNFYISLPHLSRLFKEATGTAPKLYLNSLRLSKAKDLLESTDMDIKSIAASVGFSDIHYFYRVFRKETAITPGEYRSGKV